MFDCLYSLNFRLQFLSCYLTITLPFQENFVTGCFPGLSGGCLPNLSPWTYTILLVISFSLFFAHLFLHRLFQNFLEIEVFHGFPFLIFESTKYSFCIIDSSYCSRASSHNTCTYVYVTHAVIWHICDRWPCSRSDLRIGGAYRAVFRIRQRLSSGRVGPASHQTICRMCMLTNSSTTATTRSIMGPSHN